MEHFSLNCGLKFTLFRVKNKKFKKMTLGPVQPVHENH